MVKIYRIACAAAALLIIPGCTDLTEFDHTLQAGINIIQTPDLSIVHTVENISGARSLCALLDCFIVATTEGTLIRFDLQSYQQTGVFPIGSPSSAGYFEMEYSPTESSIYIIGALGQIIEVHVPDMEFMDDFSVCETPVDITMDLDIENPCFYVAAATSPRILEIRKSNNSVSRSCILPISPVCMGIEGDTMLVGTLVNTQIVSIGGAAMVRRTASLFPKILAIEAIPNDTTLCAVFDQSTDTISTIFRYFPMYFPPYTPMWIGTELTTGEIHYMCAESDGSYVYVLSYLGDNTSRLVSYNCSSYIIESQIDLPGYPLDIDVSPWGTLLVLTIE
ncbi:MAG: hypothetical protein KAR44_05995 [Candidatus Aegiribacteria sp.]|nr:hypothetical protein [Candidatus Aegiribacteria sp.]